LTTPTATLGGERISCRGFYRICVVGAALLRDWSYHQISSTQLCVGWTGAGHLWGARSKRQADLGGHSGLILAAGCQCGQELTWLS
jgi:hypothetical protein